LLINRRRQFTGDLLDFLDDRGDTGDCFSGPRGRLLNGADLFTDILGRLGRLGSQCFHLTGNNRETLACIASPGRFDRSVQRQQICLFCDIRNKADDLTHTLCSSNQPVHPFPGTARLINGTRGDVT
ncbi:unnamed protein product, partial [Ectocarpus sp. 8 AP-2014]